MSHLIYGDCSGALLADLPEDDDEMITIQMANPMNLKKMKMTRTMMMMTRQTTIARPTKASTVMIMTATVM